MFAGTVRLPCDAARIPAAQYSLNLYCQVNQPLALRGKLQLQRGERVVEAGCGWAHSRFTWPNSMASA